MDFMTIILVVLLGVMIIFMFRSSRKRQAEAAKLQEQVVTGAQVMTSNGIFGTILDIDEETKKVLLETTPGTVLTVHRQTITRVDEPTADDDADEESASETEPGEPEFGVRVADSVDNSEAEDSGAVDSAVGTAKPARSAKAAKATDEK
ncbi:MAG: preprotein translocase subunit YajC [Candidatus Lumbricidophila eiseniae]|uniref:Preprotein translocase subunit YajC n=1 Tax=Candidatus Lumbricidiphila eiseniae TaxID=1969409 RepID=A0A2A6FT96_9MICO|nr:MAG: preprotein translocase subunit YajC [Candidatus Lumbricidophila eiseniae]